MGHWCKAHVAPNYQGWRQDVKCRCKTGVRASEAVVISSYCDKLWDQLHCYDWHAEVIQQKSEKQFSWILTNKS